MFSVVNPLIGNSLCVSSCLLVAKFVAGTVAVFLVIGSLVTDHGPLGPPL